MSINTNEVIYYVEELGEHRVTEAFKRMWDELGVVPGTAYTVCFGGRTVGKSTYAQTVATIREQRLEELDRDAIQKRRSADLRFEREQRKQLLKNTKGPRASRWS